MQLETFSIWIY